jgi:hypothetical protein
MKMLRCVYSWTDMTTSLVCRAALFPYNLSNVSDEARSATSCRYLLSVMLQQFDSADLIFDSPFTVTH